MVAPLLNIILNLAHIISTNSNSAVNETKYSVNISGYTVNLGVLGYHIFWSLLSRPHIEEVLTSP